MISSLKMGVKKVKNGQRYLGIDNLKLTIHNSLLITLVNMLGEQVLGTVLLPNQNDLNITDLTVGSYGIKLFIDNNIVLLTINL